MTVDTIESCLHDLEVLLRQQQITVPNIVLQYLLAPKTGMEWVCCVGAHGLPLLLEHRSATALDAVQGLVEKLRALIDSRDE